MHRSASWMVSEDRPILPVEGEVPDETPVPPQEPPIREPNTEREPPVKEPPSHPQKERLSPLRPGRAMM